MSTFLETVSLVSAAISISGYSLRDFLPNSGGLAHKDRIELERFIKLLEGKNVLLAEMSDEVQVAVIKSVEFIKHETEQLRLRCVDDAVQTILLRLILVMSEELHKLHTLDASTSKGQYRMYLSLQRYRMELARALALFCGAFKIDPTTTRLKDFILAFAIRPRG